MGFNKAALVPGTNVVVSVFGQILTLQQGVARTKKMIAYNG